MIRSKQKPNNMKVTEKTKEIKEDVVTIIKILWELA
jgi:hypothetical protein